MVQVWFRYGLIVCGGSGLVEAWFRFGSGVVQVWFKRRLWWFRFGSGLVQVGFVVVQV